MRSSIRALPFCLILLASAAHGEAPWHHPLSLANHGYWPLRVPIGVVNRGSNALAGDAAPLSIPALKGEYTVESLRVCNAAGTELLFDVVSTDGVQKRAGAFAAEDRVVVPLECPARSNTTLYAYAGNTAALPVRDYLRPGLLNGGFETGADLPDNWTRSMDDAQHTLSTDTAARSGKRCVTAAVADGAEPTWLQWRQGGVAITPGRTYTLSGWVRAEQVKGRCGWFIHVDGDKPQAINQLATTQGGTHDWRQVKVTFTAPTDSRSATIGTVLHGTGRAWFDDVTLNSGGGGTLTLPAAVSVTIGKEERLDLVSVSNKAPAFSAKWPVAATVRAMNVSAVALDPVLITADLRATLGRWLKIQPTAEVRVVDAATDAEIPGAARSSNSVIFTGRLPARGIRDYYVFLAPRAQSREAATAGYAGLLNTSVNVAPNGSFEEGERGWSFGDERAKARYSAAVANDGQFGTHSLRFSAPTNLPATWVGWRSAEIPVRPGATYFYSGFLKSSDLDSRATLFAHWHTAGGKPASVEGASTSPPVTGTTDWTQSSGVIQAPPDAASIQLHLTMNSHGTLQHDGVLFCEVLKADVLRLDTGESLASTSPLLRITTVNPLIKVFPDDPPAPSCERVRIECARNEFEPIQLVVRAAEAVSNLQVNISPLRGPKGATLPPVKVERVGFVPVDYPTAYYSSKAEDWQRKVPQGQGSTDGWAGEWPDPLIPFTAAECDLAANRNQPIWVTVRTLRDTPPGKYRGEITVTGAPATATLPLEVEVLPFALPEKTQLRVIFDFRFGSGGGYGAAKSGEDRKKWLRFMAEHRLGVDSIEPQPVFTYTNGRVSMDASGFDEAARYCFDELGMNVAYTPHQFYMFGWAYPPKKLFGLEPFTPEWTSAFKQAYGLFTKHIRERGWHDRFVYYISDEPHFTHEFVVDQMKRLCAMIHEVDATIPIYSSTWRHCPAWDNSLDLWGVGQYGCFPVPELEQVRSAGKHFWFTCDGQMATDTPYTATERMLPYYCLKYGAGGFEFWGLAWWTYDPWQTGWHKFINQSDDGKRHYWIRYPNGDGFLTYPGKAVGVDGPVSTIRLEQVREGLEDYEAMTILADLVGKARKAGRATAAGDRALAMAKDLVIIPNAGGLRSSDILADPDRIPAIRKAVNTAIVEMMK